MFVIDNVVTIYSKKLITDMATRYANLETGLCPMPGCKESVDSFLASKNIPDKAALFEHQLDFNADQVKPVKGEEELDEITFDEFSTAVYEDVTTAAEFDPYTQKISECPYIRDLESLHHYYLWKYTRNIAYNILTGRVNDVVSRREEAFAFVSDGDNGDEIVEQADTLSGNTADMEDATLYNEAMENLAFVMKRLWYMSRIKGIGINVLGFIQAYLKADAMHQSMISTHTTTATLHLSDVINQGIYKMSQDGFLRERVTNTRSLNADALFSWIKGESLQWVSYYNDYKRFILYCKVLNIDLINDDLNKYDMEFFNSLPITVLTSNSQYDLMVAEKLRRNNVTITTAKTVQELRDPLEMVGTYNCYVAGSVEEQRLLAGRSPADQQKLKDLAWKLFEYNARMFQPNVVLDKKKVSWRDAFMYYNNYLVVINPTIIGSYLAESVDDRKAIIHINGHLVHVNEGYYIERIFTLNAWNYIESRIVNDGCEFPKPKWEKIYL